MPVQSVKPKFKTSDGTEFDNEAEAKAYDEKQQAVAKYDDAQTWLLHCMAKTQKTADGHPWDSGDYFYVRSPYGFLPSAIRLSMLGSRWQKYEMDPSDETVVLLIDHVPGYDLKQPIRVRVSELYKSKKQARLAAIAAAEKFVQNCNEQIQDMRDHINDY